MSRRRGPRIHIGEHIGFSFRLGCALPTLLVLLAIGLATYYLVRP